MKLTLTVKLALAFTALALVAALPGVFLLTGIAQLRHETRRSKAQLAEHEACRQAHDAAAAAAPPLQSHALFPADRRFLGPAKTALKALEEAVEAASLDLPTGEVARLHTELSDIVKTADPLIAPPSGAPVPSVEADRLLIAHLDQITADLEESVTRRDARVAATVDRLAYIGELGLVATALAALGLSLVIGRAWRRRMAALREGVERVTRGDLRVRIDDREGDEVGTLARTFNRMVGELSILEEMKSQFVAVASHELRTPLTLIDGYCGILLSRSKGPLDEWQRQRIELIHVQVAELLALLQDLLDAERLQARALDPVLEPAEPTALAAAVLEGFEAGARARGLSLRLTVDDQAPRSGSADARALTRVLRNLVDNAVKYTEAGEVELRLGGREGALILAVRDTGRGIPAEELPRIFGRFYQVNDGRPRRGFGLGLSIVRGLVERNGGRIEAESEVGRGSTFTVIWPMGGAVAHRGVG
ncbi:MAG: sensor histidine kinase [Myxococcales bacterium]